MEALLLMLDAVVLHLLFRWMVQNAGAKAVPPSSGLFRYRERLDDASNGDARRKRMPLTPNA